MKLAFRIATLLAVLAIAISPALAAEKKVKLTPQELPADVKAAIAAEFPQGEILTIEKEVEGEDPGQIDIEIRSAGTVYEVEVSPDARIKEKKAVSGPEVEAAAAAAKSKNWTENFDIDKCTFASTGNNPFFLLQPGHQVVLSNGDETVTITVTNETKKVGNVETRIIEEREDEGGELKEVSRNFFAQCKETGDVFYFGEEVDDYKDGKVVAHGGAWLAGEKDSKAGIIMPGRILLGARHYQEIAPNAKDRAEIVADDVTLKTPAGEFKNCIKVEETSGLNPKEKGYKIYAPGIGIIQDEDLLLIGHSKK